MRTDAEILRPLDKPESYVRSAVKRKELEAVHSTSFASLPSI